MDFIFSNNSYIYAIIIIIFFLGLCLIKPRKAKSKESCGNAQQYLINAFNQLVTKFNSNTSRWDIEYGRAFNTCVNNRDSKSIKTLEDIYIQYTKYAEDCSAVLEDARKTVDNKKQFEVLSSKVSDLLLEMDSLVNQTGEIETNSKDYTFCVSSEESGPDGHSVGFFFGCEDTIQLDKRYRALVKALHPDNFGGSKEAFQAMQDEYNAKISKLKAV